MSSLKLRPFNCGELRVLIEQPSATAARPRRKWLWIGAAVLVAVIVAGATILAAHWPFTRENLRKALEEASGRPVEIGRFSSSYFPPGCTAEGVRFLRHKHPKLSAIITVEKLAIQGSFTGLFRSPTRLAAVRVVGMHLIVASKGPDREGPGARGAECWPGRKRTRDCKDHRGWHGAGVQARREQRSALCAESGQARADGCGLGCPAALPRGTDEYRAAGSDSGGGEFRAVEAGGHRRNRDFGHIHIRPDRPAPLPLHLRRGTGAR